MKFAEQRSVIPRAGVQSASGALRWLILASLGCVAPSACGGRSLVSDLEGSPTGEGDETTGGAGGRSGAVGSSTGRGGGATTPPSGSSGAAGTQGSPVVAPGRPTRVRACEQPVALGGGFESCSNGVVHRPESGVCPSDLPRPARFDEPTLRELVVALNATTPEQREQMLPCLEDSDCVGAAHGHCELVYTGAFNPLSALTRCDYGCTTDADCGDQMVCKCGSPIGVCQSAACQTDGDCRGGLRCTEYEPSPGCESASLPRLACETREDECFTDADCAGEYCVHYGDRRACGLVNCPDIGRPFLVGERARHAEPMKRSDWLSAEPLALEPVHPALATDAALCAELACSWTEMALMEHASIASFARFSLHLLGLGAPPELLVATTTAMMDETRHAQLCFALARRYGGDDVGPGELNLTDAFAASDFESVVLAAVKEGCIGETVSALEASEAAEHCVDTPTRLVLQRIAREEAAHAELAWRFVAWALGRADATLIERVRGTFAAELAKPAASEAPASLHDLTLLAFGVVTPIEREKLRRRALSETVLPCADVLLSGLGVDRPGLARTAGTALGRSLSA